MKRLLKKIIPVGLFTRLQAPYHLLLTFFGALIYRFPSRRIKIIGITGTKGKTTSTELVSAILTEAGYQTAIASTLRFKVGNQTERNLLKMSMPGGLYLQRFIRRAVDTGCDWLVLEMTSEGAKLRRHAFVDLDALIFTNISPEHIESHGSFENYLAAKLEYAKALARSPKPNRLMVVNADNAEAPRFLAAAVPARPIAFSLHDGEPFAVTETGVQFTFAGQNIRTKLRGIFNLYNLLGAGALAQAIGVPAVKIASALTKFSGIRGRVEYVTTGNPRQDFDVIVDYAHTADSLAKVYDIFAGRRRICVLGACGGGRDQWKRPQMGKIAGENCDIVILTNEDPYDEDPQKIIDEVAGGVGKDHLEIFDRRAAIAKAISLATADSVVIITGKGTDPFIMGPNGSKQDWDDATVAREEITKVLGDRF